MRRGIQLLIIFLCLGFAPGAWAWNDKDTHQDLSAAAAAHSVLSPTKGNYLKQLGLEKGLNEEFTLEGTTKTVKDWIRHGALKEDAGNIVTAKYYNHFHNPLRSLGMEAVTEW